MSSNLWGKILQCPRLNSRKYLIFKLYPSLRWSTKKRQLFRKFNLVKKAWKTDTEIYSISWQVPIFQSGFFFFFILFLNWVHMNFLAFQNKSGWRYFSSSIDCHAIFHMKQFIVNQEEKNFFSPKPHTSGESGCYRHGLREVMKEFGRALAIILPELSSVTVTCYCVI